MSCKEQKKIRKRCACNLIFSLVGIFNLIMIVSMIRMKQLEIQSKIPVRLAEKCRRTFEVDTVRLGRWDSKRTVKIIDHALVGDKFVDLSHKYPVCLATQTSLDMLDELIDIANHWNGSISAAVFVAGNDEFGILQQYVEFMRECFPEVRERISFQLAFPKERIPTAWCMHEKRSLLDCKKPDITLNLLLELRSKETMDWRSEYWYPQNHMRNLARKNCQSENVFLTDIDVNPSIDMADNLKEFLKSNKCKGKCAYVIPTYEMSYVASFPRDKNQLLEQVKEGYARPFHSRYFKEIQAATDFPKWEQDRGNKTHVSYEVKDISFPYEPFYVAPDYAPPHDERFVGYGFNKNTQAVEMVEDGWHFYVLSPVFAIHWGLAHDRIPLWRDVQNSYNRQNIQHFKTEVRLRYLMNQNHHIQPKNRQELDKKMENESYNTKQSRKK